MQSKSAWTVGTSPYSLIVRQTFPLQASVIGFGVALPFLAVIPLHLQERLIDEAIPAGNFSLICTFAAEYALAVIAINGLKFFVTCFRGWIQQIVNRMLRVAMLNARRSRSLTRRDSNLGAATSVITAEIEDLGIFAAQALNTPLIEGGTLLSLFSFAAFAEWRLAAIGLLALIGQALVTPLIQGRINLLTRKRIVALRAVGLDLIDAAKAPDNKLMIPALDDIRQIYASQLRMNILKAALGAITNLIMHAARIAIFAFGGLLVIRHEIGIGLVVAFLSGLAQIEDHWNELLSFYRSYTDARVKFHLVVDTISDV